MDENRGWRLSGDRPKVSGALFNAPDHLLRTVRPSAKPCRSAQLVRSMREGSTASLRGYGKTMWHAGISLVCMSGIAGVHSRRMLKMAGRLTRPTLARQDAPCLKQGRNFAADPRFTFHASRLTVPGSDARTKLADFFSILPGLIGQRGWQALLGLGSALARELPYPRAPWSRLLQWRYPDLRTSPWKECRVRIHPA